jgi:ubiquinone biosynthesis protein
VPAEYLAALERMQDNVTPVPFDQIRAIVEEELQVRLSKAFETFDEKPLAAASLGQVHTATLRGGRKVVVKVQRPDIAATIKADLDIMATSAGAFDKMTDMGRRYQFGDWVDEFRRSLASELDYKLEAQNLLRFANNLSNYPRLFVPRPIPDLSTGRVLTMDRVEGCKVTNASPLLQIEQPLAELGQDLVKAYLDQMYVHGQVHADPHPGNILLMPDGRLALLDFGMVAHLPTKVRENLLKLMLAIIDGRGEDAAGFCVDLGTRLDEFDEPEFVRAASRLVAQYRAYRHNKEYTEGKLVLELTRLGAERGLRPPPEMTLLGKTFVNLDAALIALDPKIDVTQAVKGHVQTLVFKSFLSSLSLNMLTNELMAVQELIREAPSRIYAILRMFSDNRFRIHVTGLDESTLMQSLQKIANRITAGVICTGLLITGGMMIRIDTDLKIFGLPAIALTMIVIAGGLGVTLILSSLLGDRAAKREKRGPR